jgi:hypothetical protein
LFEVLALHGPDPAYVGHCLTDPAAAYQVALVR